ncbi:helix-turn-helix transcriptional regulator [Paenibacillus elgii]|uniref:helix-turn-helix domain-containing protein n=1 Tax=Paenibacillus elgii TaxID=189691 RepID=UPI002D7AF914|nr:helix-turn-helix transcriptional regulator [Paenibacillus elgii]
MSDILRFVGMKIKDLRKGAGLTQEELGEKAGFHTTYIGGLERGERNINLSNLEQIASSLGVEVAELFSYAKKFKINSTKEESLQKLLVLMLDRDEKEINMAVKLLNEIFDTYKYK